MRAASSTAFSRRVGCWTTLVRHHFFENREEAVKNNPAIKVDATDVDEFLTFAPDVVTVEEGLFLPGTRNWRIPADLAVTFVESGGVLLILDADTNKFTNDSGLSAETGFFGARVWDGLPSPRYLRDSVSNRGHDAVLVCRPERMAITDWLDPAFEGVENIVAVGPVALNPYFGEIAASTEPTARALEADVFVEEASPTPIATIRNHNLGFAGLVAAGVSPDDLTSTAPGNITWIIQLSSLLANEAALAERTRREPVDRREPETAPATSAATESLLHRPEDEWLEFKETGRWDVRLNQKSKEMEREVAEAVVEFWNRSGGVIIIGVRDDPREVVGLERDLGLVKPKNSDGYCAWLGQLLADRVVGASVDVHVTIRTEIIEGREVARIDVPAGKKPVWLDGEIFRVRRSNGGITLAGPKADAYIRDHFA